jgi:hypothetical protein
MGEEYTLASVSIKLSMKLNTQPPAEFFCKTHQTKKGTKYITLILTG